MNKNLKEGGEKSEMLEITHDDDDDDGCETWKLQGVRAEITCSIFSHAFAC